MRYALIVLWMLSWSATSAIAQVSVGIALPGVSIGINLPLCPELAPVPGYPVYYPQGEVNTAGEFLGAYERGTPGLPDPERPASRPRG